MMEGPGHLLHGGQAGGVEASQLHLQPRLGGGGGGGGEGGEGGGGGEGGEGD